MDDEFGNLLYQHLGIDVHTVYEKPVEFIEKIVLKMGFKVKFTIHLLDDNKVRQLRGA